MRCSRALFLPFLMCLAVGALCLPPAWGQLFGERNLGRGVSRRAPASSQRATEQAPLTIGTRSIVEESRFLRGARDVGEVVGIREEPADFVGMEQAADAAGDVRSAIDVLPTGNPRRASLINRPRPPLAANAIYPPQLMWGETGSLPQPADIHLSAPHHWEQQLKQMLLRHLPPSEIEVSVAGRAATLRGSVASAEARRMAEVLLGFEPGIDRIVNRLRVTSLSDGR